MKNQIFGADTTGCMIWPRKTAHIAALTTGSEAFTMCVKLTAPAPRDSTCRASKCRVPGLVGVDSARSAGWYSQFDGYPEVQLHDVAHPILDFFRYVALQCNYLEAQY